MVVTLHLAVVLWFVIHLNANSLVLKHFAGGLYRMQTELHFHVVVQRVLSLMRMVLCLFLFHRYVTHSKTICCYNFSYILQGRPASLFYHIPL